VIYIDHSNDSAVVLFLKGELQLPESPIALLPMDEPCSIGSDVGWLGYPQIEARTLCFFAGTVSARQEDRRAYLIDGVAINGVSGGPVFHCPNPERAVIIGCVSAYHANRVPGETLPGLLRAQDVSHFHGVAGYIQSIDEGNVKKQEFEQAQAKKAETDLTVPDNPPSVPLPAVADQRATDEQMERTIAKGDKRIRSGLSALSAPSPLPPNSPSDSAWE
jgi:hypothetical protein